MLDQFRAVEQAAAHGGLTFAEAMRLVAGANVAGEAVADATPDWSRVVAGPWLAATLEGLRRPEALARDRPGRELAGDAAAVPAGRRALAAPALDARPRRLPRRRHGPRQDDAGAGADAGAAAAARTGRAAHEPARRARLAAGELGVGDRAVRAEPARARRPSVGDAGGRAAGARRGPARGRRPGRSRATARSCACPRCWRSRGTSSCSTRRRRSRTRAPGRRARPSSSTRGRGSRSPARRSRTGSATSGRSSISSTRACSDRARRSRSFTKRLAARPHNPYAPLRELVRPYILRRLKTDKTRHRRPARQDRGQGVLPAHAQAGGALPAGGGGAGARADARPTA